MKPEDALSALKRKFGRRNITDLANAIGVSLQYLQNWQKKKTISPNQLANMVKKAITHGISQGTASLIRPIFEYYPINRVKSSHSKKWQVLSRKLPREKAIIDLLSEERGVYVFYDSMYSPVYIGKTQRNNLWFEINGAYNRARDRQEVWRVQHPRTGTSFSPAYVRPRKIAKQRAKLSEVATHLSVYQVSQDFIPQVEALLIRATANVGTNKNMENL